MSVVTIVLVLLFVGFIIWLVQTVPVPVNPWIKNVIMGIIFFAVLIWLLNTMGIHTGIPIKLFN